MTEAKSTRPHKGKAKSKKKPDDLGDDPVPLSTVSPPPADGKPPGYCDDQPKHKRL